MQISQYQHALLSSIDHPCADIGFMKSVAHRYLILKLHVQRDMFLKHDFRSHLIRCSKFGLMFTTKYVTRCVVSSIFCSLLPLPVQRSILKISHIISNTLNILASKYIVSYSKNTPKSTSCPRSVGGGSTGIFSGKELNLFLTENKTNNKHIVESEAYRFVDHTDSGNHNMHDHIICTIPLVDLLPRLSIKQKNNRLRVL